MNTGITWNSSAGAILGMLVVVFALALTHFLSIRIGD